MEKVFKILGCFGVVALGAELVGAILNHGYVTDWKSSEEYEDYLKKSIESKKVK